MLLIYVLGKMIISVSTLFGQLQKRIFSSLLKKKSLARVGRAGKEKTLAQLIRSAGGQPTNGSSTKVPPIRRKGHWLCAHSGLFPPGQCQQVLHASVKGRRSHT